MMGDVLHLTWTVGSWLVIGWCAACVVVVGFLLGEWLLRLVPGYWRLHYSMHALAAGDSVPTDDQTRAAYWVNVRRTVPRLILMAAGVALVAALTALAGADLVLGVLWGGSLAWLVVWRVLRPITIGVRDGLSDREVDR